MQPKDENGTLNPFNVNWWCYSTPNFEPLAQTWIRCECLYSNGHNGLTSPKRIKSSRTRAGLNRLTLGKQTNPG